MRQLKMNLAVLLQWGAIMGRRKLTSFGKSTFIVITDLIVVVVTIVILVVTVGGTTAVTLLLCLIRFRLVTANMITITTIIILADLVL
jgi:hypothetical protein